MKKLTSIILLAGFLAACSSEQAKEQPKAQVEERPQATKPETPPETKPVTAQPVQVNPLTDPGSILSHRSVYFDYDSSVVKDEFQPLIQAHSGYLAQHRDARVTLEGNCDERGSREYNLALGQRRADAVKKVMTLQGAGGGQIDTVSFGKEKPRASGHDEASWKENRRDDLRYAGE